MNTHSLRFQLGVWYAGLLTALFLLLGVATTVVLEVTDSGVGISADALPHVFERFFRADQARSRDIGGAGLGLAIVQSIASAHGGRVTVESAAHQGSRFGVELPFVSESPEARLSNYP